MNSKSRVFAVCSLVVMLFATASTALAKDAVVATVTHSDTPTIGIDTNGNPLSSGTYAIGTLKLHYSNVASSWLPGVFTNFTLHIKTQQGHAKPATSYPADVYFRQSGQGLVLEVTGCSTTAGSTSFSNGVLTLQTNTAEADCNVRVSIPQVDVSLNFDGSLLVGNLQMETSPGAHLDTPTTVQVRVMLVFPSAACLRLFNVITDNGVGNVVDPFTISAWFNNGGHTDGTIKGTSPTNPADVVYIVNTCQDSHTVDIAISLESHFKVSGNNNMGLFTSTTFDVDTDTIPGNFAEFTVGPANSTTTASACLASTAIAGGNTLLARDKMLFDETTITGNVSNLSGFTAHGTDFTGTFSAFTSGVFVSGTSCGTASADSSPQNISLDLDFSVEY